MADTELDQETVDTSAAKNAREQKTGPAEVPVTSFPPSMRSGSSGTPPGDNVTKTFKVAMSVYIVLLNVLLLYFLIRVWPGAVPFPDHGIINLGWGLKFDIWIETRCLLIVMLSGALGSYIHLATSFADFLGNRTLVRSWTIWYLLRPFIGVALAVVVYFVVRAGLLTGSAAAGGLNIYGIAATAGLCGLFSKQATDKLRETFENLFRTQDAPKRSDPLTPGAPTEERPAA